MYVLHMYVCMYNKNKNNKNVYNKNHKYNCTIHFSYTNEGGRGWLVGGDIRDWVAGCLLKVICFAQNAFQFLFRGLMKYVLYELSSCFLCFVFCFFLNEI